MTQAAFLEITPEQEKLVAELQEAVAPAIQGNPSLQAFCTRSCYVRYLRARNWNLAKATKMLQHTLEWRASYKPDQIRWEDVAHEAADAKMWILDQPDREGRPVVLMRPRREQSQNNDTRLKYLVYTLEKASALADEHAEDGKMAWCVDFVGYSRKNAPPIKMTVHTVHILQNHYPERLGKAVSYQPPAIFNLAWQAVSPFIDSVTHKKLVFLNKKAAAAGQLGEHFYVEHLDEELGGPLSLEEAFSLERIGERYRSMDAQMDRALLAASAIGGGSGSSGAATPAAAAAGEQPGAVAAAGAAAEEEEEAEAAAAAEAAEADAGLPSPGRSVSTLGEEGSASLAAPSTGRSLSGGGEGEEAGSEAGGEVEAVSKVVGELRVAA